MYYIKCSQCGHLNEVKSEYQVFCSGCNKKLDNHFAAQKVIDSIEIEEDNNTSEK